MEGTGRRNRRHFSSSGPWILPLREGETSQSSQEGLVTPRVPGASSGCHYFAPSHWVDGGGVGGVFFRLRIFAQFLLVGKLPDWYTLVASCRCRSWRTGLAPSPCLTRPPTTLLTDGAPMCCIYHDPCSLVTTLFASRHLADVKVARTV